MALHDAYAWLRDYLTAIRAGQLHPFTRVERTAREATRRDPWGPTGLQLAELAAATAASPEHARVVTAVLAYRLSRPPEKWRNVYKVCVRMYMCRRAARAQHPHPRMVSPRTRPHASKTQQALMVTEYLLKRGSPASVALARAELAPLVARLRAFHSVGADGRDHGMNVRVR